MVGYHKPSEGMLSVCSGILFVHRCVLQFELNLHKPISTSSTAQMKQFYTEMLHTQLVHAATPTSPANGNGYLSIRHHRKSQNGDGISLFLKDKANIHTVVTSRTGRIASTPKEKNNRPCCHHQTDSPTKYDATVHTTYT